MAHPGEGTCRACIGLGSAYGALCCAALSAPYDGHLEDNQLFWMICFTLGGAFFGAVAGLITGLIYAGQAGRWSWRRSGMLGGIAAMAMLWLPALNGNVYWAIAAGALTLISAVVGIVLGCSVDAGMRTGRSYVPGVQQLVKIIRRHESASGAEVSPALPPNGCGNEVAPGS